MSNRGARLGKAVAAGKGSTAEERSEPLRSGHTENIRMTVAFAESYVFIAQKRGMPPVMCEFRRMRTASAVILCGGRP